MKRLSILMMVCIMAAVMMLPVSCQKENNAPNIPDSPIIPDPPIFPDGVLPGSFSVSATQQVHFSQGNLQYQASTDTWRFAEHQYDYVGTQTADDYGYYGGNVSGSDNRNISSTYSGWIDLFGWGTGDNPTLSSDNDSAYGTFVDWGSNPISNGGNTANRWRTLTQAEWEYLLNTRPGALSKKGTGNINGVGGLIILPDNWTLPPSGCTFICGISSSYSDWTRNSYTLSQWAQMETAGAVFLPAAGDRYRTEVSVLGGHYWLSTPKNEIDAYCIFFYGNNLDATDHGHRSFGFSVRPVFGTINY